MKLAVKRLKKFRRKNHFDAIAFTGSSGAGIAYPVSFLLGIPLICLRKSTSDNHFGSKLEGAVKAPTYIIIDDFIESGRTLKKIQRAIKFENEKANCVGIYLYHSCGIDSSPLDGVPII